jgi:hypothetical protein
VQEICLDHLIQDGKCWRCYHLYVDDVVGLQRGRGVEATPRSANNSHHHRATITSIRGKLKRGRIYLLAYNYHSPSGRHAIAQVCGVVVDGRVLLLRERRKIEATNLKFWS